MTNKFWQQLAKFIKGQLRHIDQILQKLQRFKDLKRILEDMSYPIHQNIWQTSTPSTIRWQFETFLACYQRGDNPQQIAQATSRIKNRFVKHAKQKGILSKYVHKPN